MSSERMHESGDAGPLPSAMPNVRPAVGSRVYYPALDGARFLAILLVLLSHGKPVVGVFWPNTTFDFAISQIYHFGWFGTEIFFVLSTFLITIILLRENDLTGTISIRRFYLRRGLRIFPLYYPYLLFALFIYLPSQGVTVSQILRHQLFPFMVFLGNYSYWYYVQYFNDAYSHLWSICMQEQFYLALPVLLYFGRSWPARQTAAILAAAELLTLGCRGYAIASDIPYPFIWSVTVCRLDSVVVGVVAALWVRSGRALPGNALLLAAVALFCLCMPAGQIGLTANSAWQIAVADVGAGCLIVAITNARVGSLIFANRPARFLGRISYGLYMYHEICLHLVWQWTGDWFPGNLALAWLVYFALTLALVIAVSTLSYLVWERRFIVLKSDLETVKSRPV